MYPRSDEERARRRHCGFVSFETRDMAEAAKNCLDGEDFFGMPIRIGYVSLNKSALTFIFCYRTTPS